MPFVGASENETARRRQQAGPRWRMERKFPHLPSRAGVKCADGARWFQALNTAKTARAEKITRIVFRYAKVKAGRLLARGNIEQAGVRTIRRAEPVGTAMEPRVHHG